ncbi:hypothetical protein K9N68_35310 (plasmid) [Kovacikia minuta CCNUW1]|uniref:hypothetical protein n=1 Tax=Kovacikia minuta TaxID=2931930 RepID=UPI001CCCFB1F|nr:hypothetical protein [Kovacikia minuta]UBF30461.1 hypothetical protein K9N68_35310 [Kovacikia minuta CCNUW1]
MLLHLPALPIEPFKRLQVSDGLLLTADRWRIAHDYHRKRQNIHYQSLNQAGIVSGLGVCLIAPPTDIATEHQDQRWLQIQPGIAIDSIGNPIVVPQPITFRLASTAPESGTTTVYVTVRHVDPERLQGQGDRDLVQESFRIDETSVPPNGVEVELCRVLLQPGEVRLLPSADVLAPTANQLDLRYRQQAQARPLQQVCIAQASTERSGDANDQPSYLLRSLTQSLAALYPAMQGEVIAPIPLAASGSKDFPTDLLYLTYAQFLALTSDEKAALQLHLATGTVALVEVSAEAAGIAELSLVKQQLQGAILSLAQDSESTVQRDLKTELTAINAALDKQIQQIVSTTQQITQQISILTESTGTLQRDHLLRTHPFLFAQFPIVNGHPIHLFNWGGIVLAIGSLSSGWGLDDTLSLSRETIRTAQEMGINLLHFSWQRRQLTQLQQGK